jgi:hypothetical protein
LGTTGTNQYRHLCIPAAGGQPTWSAAGNTDPKVGLPNTTSTISDSPILCLADVKSSSSTPANIGQIYDTRTFTSSIKEAVTLSTAAENGILVDSGGTNGALVPAGSATKKLYGLVVASDGGTSISSANAIVTTIGPSWVKATGGNAGEFVQSSTTGYATTTPNVPNNSFYIFAGNARTSYSSGCTSVTTCNGSLYVNMVVR